MNSNELVEKYSKGERVFSDIKIENGNFSSLNLRGIIFKNSVLYGCTFSSTDLTDADFSSCSLERCSFETAILKNANFSNADMRYCFLRNAIIENTKFRNTNLMWAHLCGNSMLKADITDAKMDWSCLIGSDLTEEQLAKIPSHSLLTIKSGDTDNYNISYVTGSTRGYGQGQTEQGYKQKSNTEQVMEGYKLKQPEEGKPKFFC